MKTCFLTCILPTLIAAQAPVELDAKKRKAVVESAARIMTQRYVFADKGEQCAKRLRERLEGGAYDRCTMPSALADAITRDLRAVTSDKHLFVRAPDPRRGEPSAKRRPSPAEWRRARLARQRFENFGFRKLERLPGNIGYVDLRGFVSPNSAGPTAVAAMAFLANSDAVIIDLRQNGGGDPAMVQLLISYFVDRGRPVHINSFFRRGQKQIDQFWTLPHVPGKRMPDVPMYVLTSKFTFSAAEEFTYNLKSMKRATIVGETTGGGAHPGGMMPLRGGFMMFVPTGRAINPITGSNWEGTGIDPHIQSPAHQALLAAQRDALDKLKNKATDEDHKRRLDWASTNLRAKIEPVRVASDTLASYVGSYGPRHITIEDGTLFYRRDDRPKRQLMPLSKTVFAIAGIESLRLEFAQHEGSRALVGLYDDGRREVMRRTDPVEK